MKLVSVVWDISIDIKKYFQRFKDAFIIAQIQMGKISKIFIFDDQPLAKFCKSLKKLVNVYWKCLIYLIVKPISNKFVNFTEFMNILKFFPCVHSKVIAI